MEWVSDDSTPLRRKYSTIMNTSLIRITGLNLNRLNLLLSRWVARYSIPFLRVSLGLVFLGFGVLKFVPDLSPAEGIATETMDKLTLGVVPGSVGLVLVALLETAIGVCLVTGRYLRLGLALMAVAMVGILSPLALLTDELFRRQDLYAPTLAGQYVLKDVVLLAAGLVVTASAQGGRLVIASDRTSGDRETADS